MSMMSILMMQLSFHRQLFSQKEIRIICFRVAWLLYVFSKSQVLPISKLTFSCNSAVSVRKQWLSHVARMFWVYRNARMFRCFWMNTWINLVKEAPKAMHWPEGYINRGSLFLKRRLWSSFACRISLARLTSSHKMPLIYLQKDCCFGKMLSTCHRTQHSFWKEKHGKRNSSWPTQLSHSKSETQMSNSKGVF